MVNLKFETEIKAPREKVWQVLWNDDTYRKWTSAFTEGSHAVSDRNEGSKILFLDGKGSGMSSIIEKKIPGEYMSFRHIGVIMDNKEQPENEESKDWAGAVESYALKEKENSTILTVELETTEQFEDYMKQTFPKSLEIVKTLSESQN